MREIVVISGKGGTGKTTTAAAFIRFAQAKAAADYVTVNDNNHDAIAEVIEKFIL